jgi:hypothetical protein
MAHCTHNTTVTLADGSTAEHTAEALGYRHVADGAVMVMAACCGQVGGVPCGECNGLGCSSCGHRGITGEIICPVCAGARTINNLPCKNCGGYGVMKTEDTRSCHSFYDIARPVGDGKGGIADPIDIEAEVAGHVQRVAELHAARHRVKSFKLDGMMKPKANQEPAK